MTYFSYAEKCASRHALGEITGHALVKWRSRSREMTGHDAMIQLINLGRLCTYGGGLDLDRCCEYVCCFTPPFELESCLVESPQ